MTMPMWLRRYGGFALVLAVLVGVLIVAPSKSPAEVQTFGGTGAQAGTAGAGTSAASGTGASPVASGPAATAGATPGSTVAAPSGSAGTADAAGVGEDCSRRAILGPNATCKPAFSGDNGGAGSKGVTDTEINLVWYRQKQNEQVQLILDSTGAGASPEDEERSLQKMVSWFNKNFQLYGRKVKLVVINGTATNKDVPGMRADAQAIDQEHKAFLVLSGPQVTFIDELARRQIISFGAPQLPLSFSTARAPFVYGVLPDADITNAHIAEYIGKRFGPSSIGQYGGDVSVPPVNGVPRKYGIVFNAIAEYAEAADDLERRLAEVGIAISAKVGYPNDINQAATSAQNIATQLTAAGVTTVLCVCDPIGPIFFTSACTKQDYYPEWFQTGYLLQDVAVLARLYDQTQWAHNFGISTLPVFRPREETPAWKMQVQEAPDETPASITGYSNLLIAFSAIELAGPRLDPATFRDAAFRFRIDAHSKFEAALGYSPTDWGGIDDAQEVWWDAAGTDEADGKTGTYRSVDDGFRYRVGAWPATTPRVFEPECLGAGSCGGGSFG